MPQVHRTTIVSRVRSIAQRVRMSLSSEIYEQVEFASLHERKGREKGIRAQRWQGIPRLVTEGL